MTFKEKLLLMVVGFVGMIVVLVVSRLSTDAVGVVVGVTLGLAATVPALGLFAWLAGRNSQPPHYPENPMRKPAHRDVLPYSSRRQLPAPQPRYADDEIVIVHRGRRRRDSRPPRDVIVYPSDNAYAAGDDFALIDGDVYEADDARQSDGYGSNDAELW